MGQDGRTFPKGTRILEADPQFCCGNRYGGDQLTGHVVKLEVPWTPEEFFEQATGAKHPLELPASASDDLERAVYDLLVMGPKDWAAQADEKLNGWKKFAKADEPLEKTLHEAIRRRKGGER